MNLSPQAREKVSPVTTDRQRINEIISQLRSAKALIQQDEKEYYNEEEDQQTMDQYYKTIDFDSSDYNAIIQSLTQLIKETHNNQVRYDPSEYVYPWVDLRPDGNLISIYSGQTRDPEETILEDHLTSIKREEALKLVSDHNQKHLLSTLQQISKDLKFNCEHSVPQSWFNEREPMRGDIHHLFTCDPVCNSIRSNYPYHDFLDYNPNAIDGQRIEEACGKSEEERFEPEYGKGTVARAMLYFMMRYPNEIESSHRESIDIDLLIEWHQQFPPDLYEKHRNRAIYEIQGNRNPFIDFPEILTQPFTISI
ncbi:MULTISPECIES: endonuclease I family protein [Virgibacillus]|uniref:Extracellular ribonuclease n=2 Tax=Virgibacillus TaxID=84406 RepID=A0A024QH90_9BACI|nr:MULTISPECIES: endonuclease [Virgibacillus]EQB37088.1 hypothetical protein M948_09405 [Virgibacillus sp. CM-4]MYL43554.1 endonuclease I [Virgibacillus massiliensis]GGJ72333.1 hypothetical protein GCM10007111_37400 [Virgibacillus kapii]CDQ41321.1 Extracellular ribonuclease precursor [Virgibacillus massiliensis]